MDRGHLLVVSSTNRKSSGNIWLKFESHDVTSLHQVSPYWQASTRCRRLVSVATKIVPIEDKDAWRGRIGFSPK